MKWFKDGEDGGKGEFRRESVIFIVGGNINFFMFMENYYRNICLKKIRIFIDLVIFFGFLIYFRNKSSFIKIIRSLGRV